MTALNVEALGLIKWFRYIVDSGKNNTQQTRKSEEEEKQMPKLSKDCLED